MENVITDRAQLFEASEQNFAAYFEKFACLPHVLFHRDRQLTWFLGRHAPGNTILQTRLPAANLDRRIEEVTGYFRHEVPPDGLGVMWYVYPLSTPAQLGKRLEAHGYRKVEGRPVMAVDLATLPPAEVAPAGLRLELVRDAAGLRDWHVASAAGFETTLEKCQVYHDAYECAGLDPASSFLHYVGYLHDQPVTSSTLLLAAGVAGLYDVSTAPAVRRQGLGRAVSLAPLLQARQRGYRYAILQSEEEGFNVYRGLGFEELYQEGSYLLKVRP